MNSPRTAAALVIGNELLTGKIQDLNVAVLAKELFALGITLRRVIFCPDEIDVIVEDLNVLRRDHDFVFTSGGVGPTHDDVTMASIAKAFGVPVVRSQEIEALLREFFGERLTERHLRMADVPEGAELISSTRVRWPAVLVGNVFILPGLPHIFQRKFPLIRERLRGDAPFVSRAVHTRSDEGAIAALLEQIVADHPGVDIGSYPRWGDGAYRVAVTFDGRDSAEVDRAVEALCQALPPDQIVADQTDF